MREGMLQDKTYGLASKTFAQQFRIENANCHGRTAVVVVKIVQPYFANQPTANFYDPSIRISDQLLKPLTGSVSGQRLHVLPANPEHLNDFGVVPHGQTGVNVLGRRGSQLDVPTLQTHHGSHH
jgi:hypothetical protein